MILNRLKSQCHGKLARWSVIALTSIMLTACGFHLRGAYRLAPEIHRLDVTSAEPHSTLHINVTRQLLLNNVQVVKSDPKVPALIIEDAKISSRTLSLFANGQAAEYEMIYRVNYALLFPDGKKHYFSNVIRRDYQDNPSNPLAKQKEKSLILNEMHIEMAEKVVKTLSTYHPDEGQETPQ
ncbi:LPS-assembly lipoprotein LptE [Algicola sagamiensis]|uniref:LPS-assembly lipoprotein LptE n=1 Tax=Algicola sagamiensis TaxID=163869 RepID=UPI000372EBF7|nr:LPS assembly lipoprotein LptE [Algicola sagamiensis]